MVPGSQGTLGELNRLDDQSGEHSALIGLFVQPFKCAVDVYRRDCYVVMFVNNTRRSHMTCRAEDGV
jgi:hypothetical protein